MKTQQADSLALADTKNGPWFDQIKYASSSERYRRIDVAGHGRPSKWELGLIGDNPLCYVAALLQMIVGLIGWGHGKRRTKSFMRSP